MNERVRSVLIGLGIGVAPLLLVDLAGTLQDAIQRDPTSTSVWWPVACYLAVGVVVALGVALGRQDRLVPITGLVVVLVVVLPTVPSRAVDWMLTFLPAVGLGAPSAVGFTIAGAYAYAAVRGGKA